MSIKKTKNSDIRYGKKDKLKDSDFDPRNIGHRISIVVPEEVLTTYRQLALKEGIGYQTLMNRALRAHINQEKGLTERLARLEKAIFKALSDESYFKTVQISHGVITWSEELDLAPDAMHESIKKSGEWILR